MIKEKLLHENKVEAMSLAWGWGESEIELETDDIEDGIELEEEGRGNYQIQKQRAGKGPALFREQKVILKAEAGRRENAPGTRM